MGARGSNAPSAPVRAAALVLAALAILAAGCRTGETATTARSWGAAPYLHEVSSDGAARPGGTLAYGLPEETTSWNPGFTLWSAPSLTVARSIFDFLAAFDDAGQVQPFLARSFEHSADFRQWTVALRPGVRFHNGRPMTAHEVVRVQRLLQASPVVGSAFALVDFFEVVDELSYRVTMVQPFAAYPTLMASQLGAVPDPDWMVSGAWASPVGTGPFRVEHWERGRELVAVRNAEYWRSDERGQRLPYLESVRFRVVPDDNERLRLLRSGDLDASAQMRPSPAFAHLRDEVARTGELQYFADENGESPEDMVVLNTRRPPFNDRRARLALAHGIDRLDYGRVVTQGLSSTADSPFAPGSPWYAPVNYPSYDPEKAQRYADEIKAANDGRFDFVLSGVATPENDRAVQYLREKLAQFGIDVRPQLIDQGHTILGLVAGNFDATMLAHFDAPDPLSDVAYWSELSTADAPGAPRSGSSLNFSGFEDDAVRTAVARAEATDDVAVHREAMAKVARRLADEAPILWLTHGDRTLLANRTVVNLRRGRLPDGGRGMDFVQGSVALAQVWLRDDVG